MADPASILVYVGMDAVGDGLIKLPFLRALRGAFPLARITWMAGKGHTAFSDILAPLARGLIDEILDEAGVGSRIPELLSRPLAGRRFDLVIDTQRRLLTTLILRRIRHGRFVSATGGFLLSDGRPQAKDRPASLAGQMMWLMEAVAPPPHALAPLFRDKAVEALAERLLPSGLSYVGLAPGAGGKHKCWPLDRFLELGQRLADRGMVPVVLLGPAEADWVAPVTQAMPDARLPLQEAGAAASPALTIALGRRMRAAIANDSGTGHMLAASEIPLLSLFGPTPPEKFAPDTPRGSVIKAQDFGGGSSMDAIPVDAVDQLLGAGML